MKHLWLKQVAFLDADGGLALKTLGFKFTYVKMVQVSARVVSISLRFRCRIVKITNPTLSISSACHLGRDIVRFRSRKKNMISLFHSGCQIASKGCPAFNTESNDVNNVMFLENSAS